jgi:hypothetical protein
MLIPFLRGFYIKLKKGSSTFPIGEHFLVPRKNLFHRGFYIKLKKDSSTFPIGEHFLVPGRTLCGKGLTWNPKRLYLEPKRVLQRVLLLTRTAKEPF